MEPRAGQERRATRTPPAPEEFSRGWATNLGALDQALDGMAGNLGAAAGAYQTTDSGAMPGAGG